MFCLEYLSEATFTELFVEDQRLRNAHSRLHVFEIQLSLYGGRHITFFLRIGEVHVDELNHLVSFCPAFLKIGCNRVFGHFIHPLR